MESISADILKKCFIAGAKNLEANKEYINELNVFPVPDGDTGTNMTMTVMSAAKAVSEVEEPSMKAVCKAISGGSLRGARGNSGVILSQLLRGFCKVAEEKEELDAELLSEAFQKASETAYKAVMKPKEGKILTVARGMSEKAAEISGSVKDLEEFLKLIIEHGDEVLRSTPELLPVLKEAGVVDSGGQGLMTMLKGVLAALQGKEVDLRLDTSAPSANYTLETERRHISTDDIKFGYCTEFLVQGDHEFSASEVSGLSAFLESIGDSIVCVADDDIIKVHVHTNHPGLAFEEGLKIGSLSRMKVDNMREEHEEKLIKDASKIAAMQKLHQAEEKLDQKPRKQEHKEAGFIAVCAGEGLSEIFSGLGLAYRVVDTATGDLGAPAYRKFDIEAWMPGRGEAGEYGEVTSTSNCTDYQARSLNIRYRDDDGKIRFVHMLNGTAVALSRAIVAIMENYQNEDGTIRVPQALVPYTGFDLITKK